MDIIRSCGTWVLQLFQKYFKRACVFLMRENIFVWKIKEMPEELKLTIIKSNKHLLYNLYSRQKM